VFLLWVNQFLIFGPLLCLHAQWVCEKKADPFTPCFPDMPDEDEHQCSDVPNHTETNNNIQSEEQMHNVKSINHSLSNENDIDVNIQNQNTPNINNDIDTDKNTVPEPKNLLNKVFNMY